MKKVVVLHESTGTKFGFGERDVVVSEEMAIPDAEHINELYPGIYVDVLEVPEPTETATKQVATEAIAGTGKSDKRA